MIGKGISLIRKQEYLRTIHSNNLFLPKRLLLPNYLFLMPILMLVCIGLIVMFSASKGFGSFFAKQAVFHFAGILIAFFIASLNLSTIHRLSYFGYGGAILSLLAVLVIGQTNMGAQRWINLGFFNLQPSEFAKIATLLALARYYSSIKIISPSIKNAIIPIILILIPACLTIIQPDLGTGGIIVMVGVIAIFISGLAMRYFVISGLIVLISLPIIWANMYDYQKKRIETFINPQSDPFGAGYHVIQSQIAIGSGGITGKGLMKGSQVQLDFLPEKHTDFAFTTFSEEFGFVGSCSIILLFACLIAYGYYVSIQANNMFCKIVPIGISSLYFFHMFINIAMTSGIFPVVGIPLPLISYGGSTTVSTMISFGILMSCDIHKKVKKIGNA